jgi:hypothetical protein
MISFSYIREKKVSKFIAAFMALNLLSEIIMPTVAMALTSGPSQAETQSFEPAGTSDMVDLFTGDFNYNIPLFDLPGSNGGYPFNLAYHSGVGMDEEASWVGLGWNVNPGAINRDKRGLPDEFNGDEVKVSLDREPNVTWGVLTGFNTEVVGANAGNFGFGAGGVFNIYSNNFKGIGYTIGTSTSYTSETSSMGFGIQLDSQEGVGANTNFSLGKNMQESNPTYAGVGVGYNSQRGLTLSVYGRLSAKAKEKEGGRRTYIKGIGIGGSSSYTFAERSFTPSFGPAVTGSNLQIKVQIGGSTATVQYTGSIGGFYRTESLQDKEKTYPAYGYNYLEAAGTDGMMDFNREKDGTVRKETPNLASPILTYDTYVATAQGFAGNYRAHRNDIGHLHDPETKSKISGWSFGVDLGLGYDFQIGAEGSKNSTIMTAGDWGNGLSDLYTYKDGTEFSHPAFEKLYYKMKGDLGTFDTDELDYIGGEAAARGWLLKDGDHYILEADRLQPSSGAEVNGLKSRREKITQQRIQRNNSIQPITNAELLENGSSTELLKEYDINYYDNPNPQLDNKYHLTGTGSSLIKFNRTNAKYKGSHNAGFTCVNSDGMRYVYALPAYNNSEEEIAFTYDGTGFNENSNYISNTGAISNYQLANSEKFKSITQTPGYAHSHLLTSVLGADYVDVTGNGISDDDYGYWVKFNYVKTTDQYKWRAPYEGAMYLRGTNTTLVDDKAMFNYGEKEMWYLASAETKTHIAIFDMSQRKDGSGAGTRYSTEAQTVKPSFRLDKIYLFSKANYNNQVNAPIIPLKTINFEYTYDLCPGVKNNLAAATGDNVKKGKLMLKRVSFSYQNNTRGSLSPYTFDYNELVAAENPNYNPGTDNTDAWGGYRKDDDFYKQLNLPYVTQFDPAMTKSAFKDRMDQQAGVWNLKKISLPNGGSIAVNYESDDYAYVQHRRATQMFKIVRLVDNNDKGKVYKSNDNEITNDERRVYFKLETPIPTTNLSAANKVFTDYVSEMRQSDGTYPMYFRIRSNLRDGLYETVSGYCDLHEDMCGVSELTEDIVGGNYTVGYITLKSIPHSNDPNNEYHPFAVAAWQYLRINMPHLLTAFGKIGGGSQGSSDKDKAIKIASLGSVIPAIRQLFSYRHYAYKKNWAISLDPDKSFIRLTTPDRIKFGGGLRVKQIAFTDNWDASSSNEHSNTYGQTYDYTITENGETYSSGVAQYEPMAAGDEIALRHPRNYTDNIPLKTDNNLYFEYPVNESLYPGASVGYRKVTVQSIASKTAAAGVSTTGTVEYQFYTTKEYPVITDETDNHVRYRNYYVPVPLVGEIVQNKLYATQGYAIMLNDMNGKLRSVTNYAKSKDGSIAGAVVSSVTYEYKHTTRLLDDQWVNVVDNTVPAIVNETLNSSKVMHCNKKDVIVGEEYDFFTDSRNSNIYSTQFGGSVDLLLFTPFAALPGVWPAGSENESDLKLFVTNKVISKSGILIKTVSTDGQVTVTTENKLFDAQTGAPLLSVVNNDFNNSIYNYSHPANWEHDGMGAAAKNAGFKFCAKVKAVDPTAKTFTIQNEYSSSNTSLSTAVTKNVQASTNVFGIDKDFFQDVIAPGDEVIIQKNNDSHKYLGTLLNNDKISACYPGSSNNINFHCDAAGLSLSPGDELYFTIVRSGRRNQQITNAGNIVALKDPTDDANRVAFVNEYPNTVCLADEVAALLNELLTFDTDLSNGHQLPLITYAISEESYPVLGKLYQKIQVGTSQCNGSGGAFINATIAKYSLTFSYINESGNCSTVACDCFIPVYKNGSTTELLDFIRFEGIADCKVKGTATNSDEYSKIEGNLSCFSPNLDKTYTGIKDVISGSAAVFSGASNYIGYTSANETNQFRNGKKGIWKPFVSYYYNDERINKKLTDGNVKLSTDGVYKGDNLTDPLQHEFYEFNWNPTLATPIPYKWVQSSANTAYDGNSNIAETKDITNTYSAVLYENSGLPIMVAKNAKRKELYNENFEEAVATRYLLSGTNIATNHTVAHTGKSSLSAGLGDVMYLSYFSPVNSSAVNPVTDKYVVSMWMSKNIQPVTYVNGSNVGISIVYYDRFSSIIGTSNLIKPSGNVIEKWQRIEGTFTPPLGTSTVAIKFSLESGAIAYFDDIRILPFNASVKTTVYDPVNYRVLAELDENNFATMYSYDGEGKQFYTKKETIAGIKSIAETRSHQKE